MFEEAWNDSHWWEALCMHHMSEYILKQLMFEEAWNNKYRRGAIYAKQLIRHWNTADVWRSMKWFTLVRSPLNESHVRIHLKTADVWRSMKGHTQERNHFHAKHVLRHWNTAEVWRSTKEPMKWLFSCVNPCVYFKRMCGCMPDHIWMHEMNHMEKAICLLEIWR